MPTRAVQAFKHRDGHLELQEPVDDLPEGEPFQVILNLPQKKRAPQPLNLPIRRGTVIGELHRRDVYDDVG